MGRLESGVFIGSPGRPLVEQALARLAEEYLKFRRPEIVAVDTGSTAEPLNVCSVVSCLVLTCRPFLLDSA
jgi:hypothetical protein